MKYKTLFVSDVHIGSSFNQLEQLMLFLKHNDFETIYLVGDIFDFWAMQRSTKYWNEMCSNFVQKILKKSRHGVKIIYIPGNHEGDFYKFCPFELDNIKICSHYIHEFVDGAKGLVIHGHELDVITKYAKWLTNLGSIGYDILLYINKNLNGLRKTFGLQYWSLSQYIKSKVKNAVNFIGSFEKNIVHYADKFNTEVVIVGHIHSPAAKIIDNKIYLNTGDFVETVSCIVETLDGTVKLLKLNNGVMRTEKTIFPKKQIIH
jgi:UDP-2,3-diacylglucosamine pyrophosphatase LpxH